MNPRDTLDSIAARYVGPEGIPLPGHGRTLARWQLLADIGTGFGAVGIKLFEAHADALAILAEVADATPPAGSRWAVWAAEPPDARVGLSPAIDTDTRALAAATGIRHGEPVLLNGRKAWCSGANGVTHALVTCHGGDGSARLAAVDLHGPGVTITTDGWLAVGMAATCSGDVLFENCPALCIGGDRAYLDRPGFWHGGAGIAACWYGAALPLADAVRHAVRQRKDPHAAAHLGAIEGALEAAAALLRETAAWIDAHPAEDAFVPAMRLRTVVEAAAQTVLQRAGHVLGAGPLCRNGRLAALYADLPVFLRQSHAERDLAALGLAVAEEEDAGRYRP
ncbi:acyl-CoA dehydrogenase family protein [Cupriavidus agavae]|uniref:Acyl-CoA dehydrogenase n=1 Tax=Cupriavidus agavae TaxID=1001822 RepID=A0A4Q7RDY5_9BURK|nr:acyl-CoA dehydrogenase [Cupriavidus agavae]RZT31371.1 hypothetical protein EV147_4552 [Cupriavidus agavae]